MHNIQQLQAKNQLIGELNAKLEQLRGEMTGLEAENKKFQAEIYVKNDEIAALAADFDAFKQGLKDELKSQVQELKQLIFGLKTFLADQIHKFDLKTVQTDLLSAFNAISQNMSQNGSKTAQELEMRF